jgi:hypothetical protein
LVVRALATACRCEGEVYLVGDYDEGPLYERAKTEYHNISRELAVEYNQFMACE